MNSKQDTSVTRRDFVKTAAAASFAATIPGNLGLFAAGSDAIKIGLIGCGGRGTGAALDCLKAAAGVEVAEPAGMIIVLEPLNWWANHPGLFLQKIPQAYQICKAVNNPSCKIVNDIYHQQITEGNLIPNIEAGWDEIAAFHLGDNPGRNEPTSGEINYRNVFKWIHNKGYKGVLCMEHGQSKPGIEGERAVIDAYRVCDQF